MGFKGVYITRTCFPDESLVSDHVSQKNGNSRVDKLEQQHNINRPSQTEFIVVFEELQIDLETSRLTEKNKSKLIHTEIKVNGLAGLNKISYILPKHCYLYKANFNLSVH